MGISIHATHAGGDPEASKGRTIDTQFQSTPPMRVATAFLQAFFILPPYFNPRHPCGWRQLADNGVMKAKHISIHATHAGGDAERPSHRGDDWYFNPRHPCGWRPDLQNIGVRNLHFNPRHL